eukprot:11182907-Lingulodinium_polyedra.AAC.1
MPPQAAQRRHRRPSVEVAVNSNVSAAAQRSLAAATPANVDFIEYQGRVLEHQRALYGLKRAEVFNDGALVREEVGAHTRADVPIVVARRTKNDRERANTKQR